MCFWKLETELSWLEEKIMHLSSGVTGAWCQKLDVGQEKNKSHNYQCWLLVYLDVCVVGILGTNQHGWCRDATVAALGRASR